MSDLQLDTNTNDLLFVNNDLVVNGDPAVYLPQRVRVKLQTFFGEWHRNSLMGVKYYEEILKKNPNYRTVDNIIQSTILDDDEIAKITFYEAEHNLFERKYIINVRILSIYGQEFTFDNLPLGV
jgi:hypothetical protein